MPFVEIFAPSDAVRDDQRRRISARVAAETNSAAGLPDTDAVRAMSWLVWRDVDHWFVGGVPMTADEPPRFLVRVTTAEGALDAGQRADIVSRVVAALAEADGDHDRFDRQPDGRSPAWVQFVEVARDNQCLSTHS